MKVIDKNYLFWDVESLDEERHASFIIERVLDRGRLEDFRWLKKRYGEQKIKEVLRSRLFRLDKRSASFWCQYFNIKPEKCIQNHSEVILKKS